jgi:hypothetical protein
MLAEAKIVLHAWLRSGNTASARGVKTLLAETLPKLPPDFRLYALGADSGVFVTELLVELEAPRATLRDRGADESARLMTLRSRLLVIGAIRGTDGRQQVLRLGLRERWRQRFAALLERIAALAVSTVAQFTDLHKAPAPKPCKPPPAELPTFPSSCV